jgi:hypothetical protein
MYKDARIHQRAHGQEHLKILNIVQRRLKCFGLGNG